MKTAINTSFLCNDVNRVVDSSDISIVIQGNMTPFTADIVDTFRRILPEAELIISTWKGEDASRLSPDKIVHRDDPGSFLQNRRIRGDGRFNNVNRQIVSTQTGLQAASRKYSLKTRSDVFVERLDWLHCFGAYDDKSPPSIFKHRVLICDYYSRNPRVFPLPFHWSDWVFFGETEDLRDIFEIPLMKGDDIAWFDEHPRRSCLFRDNINRYLPEQWICSNFLRKHMQLQFTCFYDATRENIKLTERFFAENTVIIDKQTWGICFMKYNPNRYFDKGTLLDSRGWTALYRKYCLRENGWYWFVHIARCFAMRILHYHARPMLTVLLGRLGIKERLRRFLNRHANA